MNTLGWITPGGRVPRTGGTLYNRRMMHALRDIGLHIVEHPLEARWPLPPTDQHPALRAQLASLPNGIPLVVDGLLWTGLAPMHSRLVASHACTVLVHSPLFRETGITSERAQHLRRLEAQALRKASGCIATGGPTCRDLEAQFGLIADTVPPGVHSTAPVPARNPLAMLSVATLTPRKGHDRLLRGLALVPELPWTLTCAGSTAVDPKWFGTIRELVETLGLADRVEFVGELGQPALNQAFASAGLLVHTAHYEAWGMALTEALARGIPLISTPAGALEGPAAAAAHVLPPAPSPEQVAHAVRAVAASRHAELRMAAQTLRLPTWEDRARELVLALSR